MAIKPKGKKVTGTKNNDKITWVNSSAWKTNLSVKAGAGNDVINFKKSTYKNNIYGEAGNDKIYGGSSNDKISGGKGTDLINAGKGNNSIYFAKNDGKDTIENGKGNDTLIFTDEKFNNIKAAYSGNNAILSYTGGQVILKDYKKGHSAKYIQVGSTKKNLAAFIKEKTTPVVPPKPTYNIVYRDIMSHNFNGTDGMDRIVSDLSYDTIKAGAGDDYIELQKGDATVYAGKGDDKIWVIQNSNTYNFESGDGKDLIKYDRKAYDNYEQFVFANENSIDGLSFRLNDTGFTIGYNGDKDSVTVEMSEEKFQAWKNEHNYNNYYTNEDYELETSRNITFGDNKYDITANGFASFNQIETGGSLEFTDENDYIYVFNDQSYAGTELEITEIKAKDGDDYIIVQNEGENTIDIYAGKGNDTISAGRDCNLYFESDDGDDVIEEHGSSLIFKDETSVENIGITKENGDLLIKYNEDDSVCLHYYDKVNIKIGDHDDDDNTYIIGNSFDGCENPTAYLGTDGDDNIAYSMYDNGGYNNTIMLRDGNDILRIRDYSDNLGAYINIRSDGTYDKDLHLISYYNEYDEDTGDITYTNMGSKLSVKDYLINQDTKTILNSDNKAFSLNDNFDTLVSEVVSWLNNNGYGDGGSVADAINDDPANLTTLLGTDYFGKFEWTPQA